MSPPIPEPTITCPNCKSSIRLTESLAAPLLASTKRDYEARLAEKDASVASRFKEIESREEALAKARDSLDSQIAEKLKLERPKIAADEAKKARAAVSIDLDQKSKEVAELLELGKIRDAKLAEAQKAQAEILKKERDLEDAKRELNLNLEKGIKDGLASARLQARKEVEEEQKLKVAEKEQLIAAMQKQIEELKRKAEQGSQQLQGEVQELELESLLRSKFPRDDVQPVPKGEFGGDAIQRVIDTTGQMCGTILWESKRTKNWSDGWLPKLRDDQRAAKAEITVLVTQALPRDIDSFNVIDGVWVTHPRVAIPVAIMLRESLMELASARLAAAGQQTKKEILYTYLTGPRFRQRVEAIVEAFSSMKEDLDKEKKAITKQWAKREEQIERVMQGTVGMIGDMQGIAGKSLQEIQGLDLKALE